MTEQWEGVKFIFIVTLEVIHHNRINRQENDFFVAQIKQRTKNKSKKAAVTFELFRNID